MSPSYHHAYLAGKLITAFNNLGMYAVFSELTLQINGKDYVPDVSLYSKRPINFNAGDVVKMTEMPLLVVEVLSPSQGTQDALDKFAVYFDAGIKSCWLVVPVVRTVAVYSSVGQSQTFHAGNIMDNAVNLHIPIETIFE